MSSPYMRSLRVETAMEERKHSDKKNAEQKVIYWHEVLEYSQEKAVQQYAQDRIQHYTHILKRD